MLAFDSQMSYMSTRKKLDKLLKERGDNLEEDQDPPSTVKRSPKKSKEDRVETAKIHEFKRGDQITIVDGDGEALAHGNMHDAEPDLDDLIQNAPIAESCCESTFWKKVTITTVVKGSSNHALDKDVAFGMDGCELKEYQRKLSNLSREDWFYIWGTEDVLVPRIRATRKNAQKRKRAQ